LAFEERRGGLVAGGEEGLGDVEAAAGEGEDLDGKINTSQAKLSWNLAGWVPR